MADSKDFSNGIRLTGRNWLIVLVFSASLLLVPLFWKNVETFSLERDYRMPHDLSNDYWLYQRWTTLAAEHHDTVVIGDSVVWGEYATQYETLSHYLNEQAGDLRYANLGLDGAHPLALEGLIEHYAGAIANKNVILQCNPLWLTSPRRDLRDDKESDFNHPRLVAQFTPHIPAYKEEISTRLGVLVEQRLPLDSWANHLQQAYYNQSAIPSWTIEHPYENPLTPLTRGLPQTDPGRRHPAQPWLKSKIDMQDYPWIDMGTSLQWAAFQRVVKLLQQRGNHVFVLVGPFNEHLLKPASAKRYAEIKSAIEAWLKAERIPHLVPPPLPSEQYGDASHPLAEGYAALARQVEKARRE